MSQSTTSPKKTITLLWKLYFPPHTHKATRKEQPIASYSWETRVVKRLNHQHYFEVGREKELHKAYFVSNKDKTCTCSEATFMVFHSHTHTHKWSRDLKQHNNVVFWESLVWYKVFPPFWLWISSIYHSMDVFVGSIKASKVAIVFISTYTLREVKFWTQQLVYYDVHTYFHAHSLA